LKENIKKINTLNFIREWNIKWLIDDIIVIILEMEVNHYARDVVALSSLPR